MNKKLPHSVVPFLMLLLLLLFTSLLCCCQEVDYVRPARWCVFEEVEEVEVVGEGFTGNLDMEESSCMFRINEDELFGKEGLERRYRGASF